VERLIEDVIRDMAMPMHWGKNQKGMQADVENNAEVRGFILDDNHDLGCWGVTSREGAWIHARDQAICVARAFDAAGYHKQIVNRLLEPFSHINVVVTSTEWDNFFALRDHPHAQPEMQVLARAMKEAMSDSTPRPLRLGQWHLPYVHTVFS